ncbi:MAG: SUMF1/EgtB/PvdO family nonheme iron enzyme, partial [Verrucomicrobiales bacterium]|nr:SUMF1/EgtB/PvdO family nonheme iron enzyme [Verrucomicrobiales bacterium]
ATKESPFVNSLGMKFVPVPGTKILMCTTETTVAQYQAAGMGYQAPGFSQGSDHPAVNVSWNDAKAWCAWLSKKEGRKYRLPTDAEWSAAVGTSTYPWGNLWPPPNNCGNYAGQEMRGCTAAERQFLFNGYNLIGGFRDRHKFTAPVGSYAANQLGIHDLGGNALEWCEDWDRTYGTSKLRVMRGGWWGIAIDYNITSACRTGGMPDARRTDYGFRCVVER